MSENWDAPMELIYTHELEALRAELEVVKAQRDAALAQLRGAQCPITYSSGGVSTPPLGNLRVWQ